MPSDTVSTVDNSGLTWETKGTVSKAVAGTRRSDRASGTEAEYSKLDMEDMVLHLILQALACKL